MKTIFESNEILRNGTRAHAVRMNDRIGDTKRRNDRYLIPKDAIFEGH